MRPGREHDTTALRLHTEVLPQLAEWTDQAHAALADLGYQGERDALTTPIKTPAGRRLTGDERCVNLLHAATRGPAERGNSLLKTSFKALRRVSLCPWRIGAITTAALSYSATSTAEPRNQHGGKPLLGTAHSQR